MDTLTPDERKAIKALRTLSKNWPSSLTLTIGSMSTQIYVVRTPQEGDVGYDDLGQAECLATIPFPVGASA